MIPLNRFPISTSLLRKQFVSSLCKPNRHAARYYPHPLKISYRKFSRNHGQGQGQGTNEVFFVIARLGARILGRLLGNAVQKGHFNSKRFQYGIIGTLCASAGIYLTFSEEIPYSGRRHLVYLSYEEESKLGDEALREIQAHESAYFYPKDSLYVERVATIAQNILNQCREDNVIPPHLKFEVHVIESPLRNAFVLPNGHIFVYTGILPVAKTEAGLAAIMGHEISHALARHANEKLTDMRLLLLYYEFLRGFNASFERTSWWWSLFEFVAITVLQAGLPLVYSRNMETEADHIGLKIAANAGYDPRHAANVWRRMIVEPDSPSETPKGTNALMSFFSFSDNSKKESEKLTIKKRLLELTSTHPCPERRIEDLEAYGKVLFEEYEMAVRRLELVGNVPDSNRLVTVNRSDVDFDFDSFEEYDDRIIRSAAVAQKCAALMVGQSYEEDIFKMAELLFPENKQSP